MAKGQQKGGLGNGCQAPRRDFQSVWYDSAMTSFEDYLTNAEALAQEVVNVWGIHTQAGNADSLTPEFMDVFDKACRYQEAKQPADFYRKRNALPTDEGQRAAQTEETARRVFIEAYKPWVEKHAS